MLRRWRAMSEINKNPEEKQYSEAQERWGFVKSIVRENFKFLVLGVIIYLVLAEHGFVPVPDAIDPKPFVFALSGVAFGKYVIKNAITLLFGDKFTPDGEEVDIATRDNIRDTITIPSGTFTEYDVAGAELPTARNLTGERKWGIQAIDTGEQILYPAGPIPEDDKTPSHYEFVAEDSLDAVTRLENRLLELAKQGRKQQVSEEVLKEQAMNEVTKEFARSMMEIRDSGADLEQMSDEEIEEKAQQKAGETIQKFAEIGGDDDE
jgi:hypothetical protein